MSRKRRSTLMIVNQAGMDLFNRAIRREFERIQPQLEAEFPTPPEPPTPQELASAPNLEGAMVTYTDVSGFTWTFQHNPALDGPLRSGYSAGIDIVSTGGGFSGTGPLPSTSTSATYTATRRRPASSMIFDFDNYGNVITSPPPPPPIPTHLKYNDGEGTVYYEDGTYKLIDFPTPTEYVNPGIWQQIQQGPAYQRNSFSLQLLNETYEQLQAQRQRNREAEAIPGNPYWGYMPGNWGSIPGSRPLEARANPINVIIDSTPDDD